MIFNSQDLQFICFVDVLLKGDMDNSDMNLYWDSWDRHNMRSGPSPRPVRSRTTRCSVPSEDSIPYNNNNNNNNLNSGILAQSTSVTSLTSTSPPSTPLLTRLNRGNISIFNKFDKYMNCEFVFIGFKFPTTPPSCKKYQIGLQTTMSQPEVFPLTKSKSHESQLANRLESGENNSRYKITKIEMNFDFYLTVIFIQLW